jgi:hypothetical protein
LNPAGTVNILEKTMKHWLMAAALICLCAVKSRAITQVSDTINKSTPTASVAVRVSSYTATLMTTSQFPDRVVVEIQNVASSGNLFCVIGSSFTTPSISTTTPNAHMITAAGGTWTLGLANSSDNDNLFQALWCMGDSVTSALNAVVTQLGKKP